jgi:Zn-dependent peptidase ImmA (M78 family)/DNA-binding XRE family transcriptional regulator
MNRLKTLRTARSLSLDQLAAAIGSIVSKQALSKYEQGVNTPSPKVAMKLADFFGVPPTELWSEPSTRVEFLAYRCRSSVTKSEQAQIEALVELEFQQRVDLQERCLGPLRIEVPVHAFEVKNEADAEMAAMQLRMKWNLGLDPISDLIALLEDHQVYVLEISSVEGFDGLSAVAQREDTGRIAVAVVSRNSVSGDRQRFSLAHELAHIVMRVKPGSDVERFANRFAGAFLVPASVLQRDLGASRTSLNIAELVGIKRYCKVSIQSLVKRAYELSIISEPTYRACFTYITQMGWRKQEPEPVAREKSQWIERVVLRGVAEGILTSEEGRKFVGDKIPIEATSGIFRRKHFLNLSSAEQKAQLEAQALRLAEYYKDRAWGALETEGL